MDTCEEVVLLNEAGVAIGTALKHEVHHRQTPLHLAFSCYVIDDAGRLLVTRRALGKQAWPGVWTNSFCGHPSPGEEMPDAVRRRARQELSIELEDLALVLPDFRYRALDASGIVENEICPVFRATIVGDPRPDQNEVCEYVWAEPGRIHAAAQLTPWAFSPWFVMELAQLEQRCTA